MAHLDAGSIDQLLHGLCQQTARKPLLVADVLALAVAVEPQGQVVHS